MHEPNLRFQIPERRDDASDPAWVPRIDPRDVLERMIADELRAGRLTPARRSRVLRYAAGMGLSAVQAGRLLEQIRNEALEDDEPEVRQNALRLVPPAQTVGRMQRRIAIGMALTVLLQLVLFRLVF